MKHILKGIMIAGMIGIATITIGGNTTDDVQKEQVIHVVKRGETLWDIAQIENKNDRKDIRNVIDDIIARNNIAPNQHIVPGQKLILEVEK